MWRSPALLSRLPLTNASKWDRSSCLLTSSLLLKCARLWAPKWAPSEKWPRRLNKHADWACIAQTENLRLTCWMTRDFVSFPRWIPFDRDRLRTFSSAKFNKRLCRSCEHSDIPTLTNNDANKKATAVVGTEEEVGKKKIKIKMTQKYWASDQQEPKYM